MATAGLVDELKGALKDALERRGALSAVRAQLQREIFTAMEEGTDACHPTPPENIILNELVREYLEFNSEHAQSARAQPHLPHRALAVSSRRLPARAFSIRGRGVCAQTGTLVVRSCILLTQ